ncbi:MAG: nuclear transport factor 2 family protein [Cytophagaceae bacterium]|nr:MAG: nuclear transport factor 2 family protein [Cytophagaceae bacterium]
MSFDPMGLAIDWLDAYRRQSLADVLELYAGSAAIECGCTGSSIIVGKGAIAAYWIDRFKAQPATCLVDIQPQGNAVMLTYKAVEKSVNAVLHFDAYARIRLQTCGPDK